MSEKPSAILTGVKFATVEPTPRERAPERITEIQLDVVKVGRIIAQMLRDDQRLLPEMANTAAAAICRRLLSAMPTPSHQALQGHRIIGPVPPLGDRSFTDGLGEIIDSEVDRSLASEVWALVYGCGRELPASIADPVRRTTFWK